MSQHEWDDRTSPGGSPSALATVRRLEQRTEAHDVSLGAVMRELGKLRSEVAEWRMAGAHEFRTLNTRLDNIENLARIAARRAEDSSHDLTAFKVETRRTIMLKNASLPTAIIVAAVLLTYAALTVAGKDVPHWLMAAVGIIGTMFAGVAPALFGSKPDGQP